MSKRILFSLSFFLRTAALVLAGCATKQPTGTVIGVAALAGHQSGGGRGQTLMTIAGAIAGPARRGLVRRFRSVEFVNL